MSRDRVHRLRMSVDPHQQPTTDRSSRIGPVSHLTTEELFMASPRPRPAGRNPMNAPASIRVTPVQVADLTGRGRARRRTLRLCHRRSRWPRAGRHRHDGVVPAGRRHGSSPRRWSEQCRTCRHRHGRQQAPGLRRLWWEPLFDWQADRYVQRRELDDAISQDDYTIRERVEAPGVRHVPVDGELEPRPGVRLLRHRATHLARRWWSSRLAGRPVVVAGDAAVWFG